MERAWQQVSSHVTARVHGRRCAVSPLASRLCPAPPSALCSNLHHTLDNEATFPGPIDLCRAEQQLQQSQHIFALRCHVSAANSRIVLYYRSAPNHPSLTSAQSSEAFYWLITFIPEVAKCRDHMTRHRPLCARTAQSILGSYCAHIYLRH